MPQSSPSTSSGDRKTADQLYDIWKLSEKEREAEKKYDQISESIIGMTPWGQFYGLMEQAKNIGEGMLKHEVCIAKDGRVLNVAKRKFGKWVKSYIRPHHELASKSFSQKKFGRGILELMPLVGQIPSVIEQKNAKCFGITPDEFMAVAERRKKAGQNPQQDERPKMTREQIEAQVRKAIEVEQEKERVMKNIAIGSYIMIGGSAIFLGFLTYYLVKRAK